MRTSFTLFIVALAAVREDEGRRFSTPFRWPGPRRSSFRTCANSASETAETDYAVITGKRIAEVATAAEALLVSIGSSHNRGSLEEQMATTRGRNRPISDRPPSHNKSQRIILTG